MERYTELPVTIHVSYYTTVFANKVIQSAKFKILLPNTQMQIKQLVVDDH